MSLFTGQGTKTSSGSIVIKTANAGTTGVSGFLMFSSGTTSSGSSGGRLRDRFRILHPRAREGPSASVLEMGPLRTAGEWSRSLQARLLHRDSFHRTGNTDQWPRWSVFISWRWHHHSGSSGELRIGTVKGEHYISRWSVVLRAWRSHLHGHRGQQ